MREATAIPISPGQRRLDRKLILSVLLAPVAAGVNTVAGFTVAHWVTISAYKRTGYLVAASSFLICVVAALLAQNVRSAVPDTEDSLPCDGRQIFMANLALLLAALCAIVVIATTLVLVTLRPSD